MNFKFGKITKSAVAIYCIFLVVYITGFLIIPFDKIAASWISFAFTIISIICSWFIFMVAFNAKQEIVSKVYGYPIFKVGAIYVIVQFFVGIIICAIASFTNVPYWIALLLSLIMLAAASIGVILTDNTRDWVEKADEIGKEEIKNITNFRIDISGIVDICENQTIKSKLEELNDEFCYSDPVSSTYTKEIEEKINNLLQDLKRTIEDNDADNASLLIKKVSNALTERNRICKARK